MVGLLVGRPECLSEGTLGLPFMIFFLDSWRGRWKSYKQIDDITLFGCQALRLTEFASNPSVMKCNCVLWFLCNRLKNGNKLQNQKRYISYTMHCTIKTKQDLKIACGEYLCPVGSTWLLAISMCLLRLNFKCRTLTMMICAFPAPWLDL